MDLAAKIGKNLKGGECIELISDVGGGKTTFTKGLAHGAGSRSHVSSPTFTISKVYKAAKFNIVHFDFYRLQDAGLIEYEIEEAVFDTKTVIVVEWSDVVKHVLPEHRLRVKLSSLSEHTRRIEFAYPPNLDYLVKDIK